MENIRFNNLSYLHTDFLDDSIEMKFGANFLINTFDDDIHTIELWLGEDSYSLVIVNQLTNEIEEANKKEFKSVMEFISYELEFN